MARELGHHLLVVDDRSGDELGEEGDEQQVVGEVVFAGLAAVGIDEVGDLLEGEERDAERQDDRQGTVSPLGERAAKVAAKKPVYLK